MRFSDPSDAIRQAYHGDYAAASGYAMAAPGRKRVNRDNSADIWQHNLQGEIRAIVDGYLPEYPARHAWAMLLCVDGLNTDAALHHESLVLDWLFDRVYRKDQYKGADPFQVKRGNEVLYAVLRGVASGRLFHDDGTLYLSWIADAVGLHRSQFIKTRYWGAFVQVAMGELKILTTDAMAPVDAHLRRLPRYGLAS